MVLIRGISAECNVLERLSIREIKDNFIIIAIGFPSVIERFDFQDIKDSLRVVYQKVVSFLNNF